jgi:FlaA1/EpsC-like NDP-sugar epimerase
VRIEYTGLRPGEKLHEALFYEWEALEQTAHGAIRRVKPRLVDTPELDELLSACRARDAQAAMAGLKRLVEEYRTII